MTSRTTSAVSYRGVKCRRALGYLLLLLITYGSTVEAVHSHVPISRSHRDVAAISDASGSPSSNTGHSPQTECPLCQFQQQLFNGLIDVPLFALTPSAQIASPSTLTEVCPTPSTTPPSGRAPPLN